ncbi:hypothetical protein LPJ59_000486 [Coemansia sp. RSA 2399]|nr:hypothetical protein LPJ59_000486 [Coemansia sp. RSA 2399]
MGYAKKRRRPPYSYTALIAQAIILSKPKQLTLREIYDSINDMYPQICQGPDIGWQNTIRHNLSLNQCFKRIPRNQLPPSLSSKLRGKGSYWTVDVTLMDPNTRKRLQEAIALGKPAPASTFNQSELQSPQNKRAKRNAGADAPPMPSPRCFAESMISYPATFTPRSYGPSEVNSSPSSFARYNGDDIHYVNPAVQSPSPYFQSTMNSPITTLPTISAKHAHKDFVQGYFPSTNSNIGRNNTYLPPIMPTMPSAIPYALPNDRQYIRTHRVMDGNDNKGEYVPLLRLGSQAAYEAIPRLSVIDSRSAWESSPESPPPLGEANTPSGNRYSGYHYAYGTAISHTRSTARVVSRAKEPAALRYWPTAESGPPSVSSTLESRQQTPHSLSPVSNCPALPDSTANECVSVESEKLNIKHLLN